MPVFSAPGSCGRGSRPTCALWAAIVCTNFLSYVPPCPCCRSPRKGFLPHSCGVFPTWGPTKSSDFVGRGAAAERVSFRHLAEANDTQLAATRHAPRNFGTTCPEVTSGQSVQKLAPCSASPAGVFLFGRSFGFQGAAHRWTTLSLHLNDRPSRISER